ncbi:MAG TPA: cytochrome P450 [Thermoanaerobaculia bacterium]|jgi:cytochrome P450|nr:cytochrome P450 [Thermoanaerobaculia bacterium]
MTKSAPGPKGYPLVGVVPFMIKHGAEYLLSVFRRYGDVAELRLLGRMRMFLISHPDDVEYVLKKNHRNFLVKRPSLHLEAMMGKGLTLSNGDLWLRQRRLMQPAFHRQKIEAMVASISCHVAERIDHWETAGPIELASEMEQLSLNSMLAALFGSGINRSETRRITDAVELVLRVAGRGMFLEVPPFVPTPENLRVKRALKDLTEVVLGLIEQRRHAPAEEQRQDLLSLLLEAHDDEVGMSEQQLRDEVTAVLVAGYESTAVTLTWMFYLLSRHPGVEQRLRQEIGTVLGNRSPTLADLPSLEYLHQVIAEAMRYYPAFWAMTRETVADDEIGGFRIPAKSLIVVSPFVTHKHPGFWDEPDNFDPDRFSKERSVGRHRFAYFPFGAGPRVCIGERQAQLVLQLSLVMILQRYQLKLVPNHPVEIHTAMTIRPKYGMLMHVSPVAPVS